MSLSFNGAHQWWDELQPQPSQKKSGDRAALARLRRCATVAEAMQEPATIDLYRRCGGQGVHDLAKAALAAAVLAHVREDNAGPIPVARRIGPEDPAKPETALVKPVRFRRLLAADTDDEMLTAFRRLVSMTDRSLNVRDLIRALLNWTDDTKRRWIFNYWNAGPPPGGEAMQSAEEATS